MKLRNIYDILQSKLVKRGLSIKILDAQPVENALGGNVRQVYNLRKGLTQELAKKIVADIKDSKLKVQASIQGDSVRVSGKSRDDLQNVIQFIRQKEEEIDAILPTMGGQTGLNIATGLGDLGLLEGIKVLGSDVQTIKDLLKRLT